jgi:hypothetical protein
MSGGGRDRLPPLTISDSDLERGLELLEVALM